MMLDHPAALVLLVQEVQRLAIEREVRIVDVDRRLPGAGVERVVVPVGVCPRDEPDVILLLTRGRHHLCHIKLSSLVCLEV